MCLFLKKKICEIKFEKQRERKTFFFAKNSQKFCTEYDCKDRVRPTYFFIAVVLTRGGVLMN